MDGFLQELLKRKLILVSGKGGIGKTSISALIALHGASQGKKTLLVEFAAHDQVAPAFGLASCGHVETSAAPNLRIINLNARDNFKEYIVKYLGLGSIFEKVFANHVVTSFIETIPGIAELMLLGRLFYSAHLRKEDPFDLVVFDGSASGHFLNLMTTPQAVADAGLIGPVRTESDRIREFLSDDAQTALVLVTTPDELAVNETLEFVPKLVVASPAKPKLIFANRVLSRREIITQSHPVKDSIDLRKFDGFPALRSHFEGRAAREVHMLTQLCQGMAPHKLPILALQDRGALPDRLDPEWALKMARDDMWSLTWKP